MFIQPIDYFLLVRLSRGIYRVRCMGPISEQSREFEETKGGGGLMMHIEVAE